MVWTPEEIKLLIELDTRFRSARFPNIEIQRFLPNKTADQIRNKRKDLPRLVRQHSTSSADDEGATALDDTPTSNQEEAIDYEAIEEVVIDENADEPWLENVKKTIQVEAQVSKNLEAIYSRLMEIWSTTNNDLNKLSEGIENCIATDLTPFLLKEERGNNNDNNKNNNSNNKSNNNGNNSNNRNSNSSNNSKSKYKNNNSKKKKNDWVTRGGNKKRHNAKRKYEYARAQELYVHCPKKLANMILKDDLSMISTPHPLPDDRCIENLYTRLWGTMDLAIRCPNAEQVEEPLPLSLIPPFGAAEV